MASPRGDASAAESIILEEEIDENYEPSEEGACAAAIPRPFASTPNITLHSRENSKCRVSCREARGHKRCQPELVPLTTTPHYDDRASRCAAPRARYLPGQRAAPT